jgi:hypothetical protein
MNPAIVVNAYNRPQALARLLDSLQAARYPDGVPIPLVISLDDAHHHPAWCGQQHEMAVWAAGDHLPG